MRNLTFALWLLLAIVPAVLNAQQVELFQQFNGRYDYLAFGNTLNPLENSSGNCSIFTESSAGYSLQTGQTLVAAFLYWAGSGDGDFEVLFNDTQVIAERQFSYTFSNQGVDFDYFGAMADITDLLINDTSISYTLSELDLTTDILPFCVNQTNFGGWAVTLVFEDPTLPLNQVNIFDGFESVSGANPSLTIVLDNLDVLDNAGAKIGFLAWEGDSALAVNETLRINGNILSNPPLNPPNNAFNSTNTFTNSSELYNMDIDFYDIEDNIQPGDTNAVIQLTSGQDLVIINNIVTVLNQELPDATISIELADGSAQCGDLDIEIDYTVFNVNSTGILPAGTPIAFYEGTNLVAQTQTVNELPIGGSESGSIIISFPPESPSDVLLRAVVDDDGNGNSTVVELNEDNNEDTLEIELLVLPVITGLIDLEECDIFGTVIFDLTQATAQIDTVNTIKYYRSQLDALQDQNPITNPGTYQNSSSPETIWIRVSNEDCFVIDSFEIVVVVCPYPDATITINNDLNACRQRETDILYTVYNTFGRGPLPAGTPIAFYVDNLLVGQAEVQFEIPIGGQEDGNLPVELPMDTADEFTMKAVVDDDGTGMSTVLELDETNNEFEQFVIFSSIPQIRELPELLLCDDGFETAIFDLNDQSELITSDPLDTITYFTSLEAAIADENPITNPGQYQNTTNPQPIYVRLENEICFATSVFEIRTEKCTPFIPEGISPNGDSLNDKFEISGLLDIFLNYELNIYSRYGNLIFKGNNGEGFWDGKPNRGLLYNQNTIVPPGTYYYVLNLNDPLYPDPIMGFVYVNY